MKRLWEKLIYKDTRVLAYSDRSWYHKYFWIYLLLSIISMPYYFISRAQLALRRSRRSREWKARVISIGNITVGGSGKTPVTIYLADWLHERGKRLAIVHSGYGRKEKQEFIIKPGEMSHYDIRQIGDEVMMMGQRLPYAGFAVGTNKKQMVRLADEKLNPDIILIDDGFQRLDIEKDVEIVIISSGLLKEAAGERNRMTCQLFPRGVLRESLSSLGRADVIYIIRESEADSVYVEFLQRHNSSAKVVPWVMSITGIETDGETKALSFLKGKRPFAFASIGSYYRFLRMLRREGVDIVANRNFGDHHTFSEKDYKQLKRWSDRSSADCYLTTAKDMVKLPPSGLDKPVYCLQMELTPDNESQFEEAAGLNTL